MTTDSFRWAVSSFMLALSNATGELASWLALTVTEA